eukprot:1157557-Pelagomonas_calceolata.AAC.3
MSQTKRAPCECTQGTARVSAFGGPMAPRTCGLFQRLSWPGCLPPRRVDIEARLASAHPYFTASLTSGGNETMGLISETPQQHHTHTEREREIGQGGGGRIERNDQPEEQMRAVMAGPQCCPSRDTLHSIA